MVQFVQNVERLFTASSVEGVVQFFGIVERVIQFLKNVEVVFPASILEKGVQFSDIVKGIFKFIMNIMRVFSAPIVVVEWSTLLRMLRLWHLL